MNKRYKRKPSLLTEDVKRLIGDRQYRSFASCQIHCKENQFFLGEVEGMCEALFLFETKRDVLNVSDKLEDLMMEYDRNQYSAQLDEQKMFYAGKTSGINEVWKLLFS